MTEKIIVCVFCTVLIIACYIMEKIYDYKENQKFTMKKRYR